MRIAQVLLAMSFACACSPPARPEPDGVGSDAGVGSSDAAVDASAPDAAPADAPVSPSLVYAHTGSVLYRVDATTLSTIFVGEISGLGTSSLTDLAIDKNQNMVGITLHKVFSLALPSTGTGAVVATPLGSGSLPSAVDGATSLSFIPTSSDPNSDDILVTADGDGNVYSIDPDSGSATMLGSYGSTDNGEMIASSGDLIGERGLGSGGGVGIYATVTVGNSGNDYLASIDPITWKATPLPSSTGFPKIFGLGFWGGTVYGFASGGQMLTIDTTSGLATVAPNPNGGQEWYGAGVTTNAPIIIQ